MMSSGLVMLLPHGYDGAASEHSSSRMERFLQMTDSKETVPDGDDVNMHLIFPTTPAQYFHAMRRQILRNFRKPLVVIAPKTMLRMSEATSSFEDFLPGTHFKNVLPDTTANPKDVKRVIFCSGKHYYNLNNERTTKQIKHAAIVRVESLCPFPVHDIQVELAKYKNATTCIWSQEEHRNMGAWSFVHPRFENMCGRRIKYCGRSEAGELNCTACQKLFKLNFDFFRHPSRWRQHRSPERVGVRHLAAFHHVKLPQPQLLYVRKILPSVNCDNKKAIENINTKWEICFD